MLVIRMQRTGRSGHAQFRIVVQDKRVSPISGRVVASIGSYNPHTKEVIVDAEKAKFYLDNGAQPSGRVALLLKAQKVTLPSWVELQGTKKQKTVKNAEKLRRNRPAEPEAKAEEASAVSEEAAPEQAPAAEVPATEEPQETTASEPETPIEEPAKE